MDSTVEEPIVLLTLTAAVIVLAAASVASSFFAWRAAVASRDASANSYLTMTDSTPPPVRHKPPRPYRVIGG